MKRLSSKDLAAHHSNTCTPLCCQLVKEALIDLYVNVKVRNDTSMMDIQTEDLEAEKALLQKVESLDLIEYIKSSVEVLVSLKNEDDTEQDKEHFLNQKSLSSI